MSTFVHGDIRHLENTQPEELPFIDVHGDIRHLEIV
ncbi:hypothetical protein F974_00168, partial [Acinetobacter sp. CIP 102159]